MELKHTALVIVDISGYTQFLRNRSLSLLHAEDIITQLLEAVIDEAEFPLILNKLEGDAAFLYAFMEGAHTRVAQDILQQVLAFFPAFHNKAAELSIDAAYCNCDACSHIDSLRLKAFLHHGEVVIKQIRQFEELAGDHVILVHRLLKNSIPFNEYILMTDDFAKLTEENAGFAKEERREIYDDGQEIKVSVFYPDPKNFNVELPPVSTQRFNLRAMRLGHMLKHFLGISHGREFAHIPNKRVGFLELMKEMFK